MGHFHSGMMGETQALAAASALPMPTPAAAIPAKANA
jgi:hypothetical protein